MALTPSGGCARSCERRSIFPTVAGPAARVIEHKLPHSVATAVIEFITGTLLHNPHHVGKKLQRELLGTHCARRGAFRVVYEIDEAHHRVIVLRVGHRADVYRPR